MPLRLPYRPSAAVSQLWYSSTLPEVLPTSSLARVRYGTIQSEAPASSAEPPTDVERLPGDDFHRTATRHVLRGILRECTYLPDRFAASWVHQHAISRFRSYEYKNKKHAGDTAYDKRLEIIRRKSRQALYQLQRANEGDKKMLLKALSMAYGRVGRRRRELLKPLLPVEQSEGDQSAAIENPNDEDIDLPQTTPGTTQGKGATPNGSQIAKGSAVEPVKAQIKAYVANLPAPLRALVQSQIAASPPAISRRNPRRLGVEIPELNTWYKPMPAERVNNKLAQWYASLLDTVQPPLPEQEWHDLRELALGNMKLKLPIRRRKKLTAPPSILELVVMRGKLPADLFRKEHAHTITPRFMQRLWAEVFSQCPLMQYDTASGKWNTTWGHHVLHNKNASKESDTAKKSNPAKAAALY